MKLTLAQRIMASNVILLSIFLIVFASIWFMMSRMDVINDDIKDNNLPQLTALSALNDSISVTSTEITNASHDLSGRTEQQASNLEQMSTTTEELNGSVQNTSQPALAMRKLSNESTTAADAGGVAVGEVVHTMEKIQAASREIGNLIGSSTATVNDGAVLVEKARDTMSVLHASVQRVQAMIGEISEAPIQQAHSLTKVTLAVPQLDEMTQQNAAKVEESMAASDNLWSMGSSLQEQISHFRI